MKPTFPPKHFGQIIESIRTKNGWTIKELAEKMKLSDSTCRKMLGRETIDMPRLRLYSQLLETDLIVHYISKESQAIVTNLEAKIKRLEATLAEKENARLKETTTLREEIIYLKGKCDGRPGI